MSHNLLWFLFGYASAGLAAAAAIAFDEYAGHIAFLDSMKKFEAMRKAEQEEKQ